MPSIDTSLEIRNLAQPSVEANVLDPRTLEFGRHFTPNFFIMEYSGGEWRTPRIQPLEKLSLHPAALVLHYAQEIFEGLKAYRWENGTIALFRPEMNARRMNASADRMSMPRIDQEFFVRALTDFVRQERSHVPGFPGSLYLRPVMFGSEAAIGVKTANEFIFFIMGLPSGSYFKDVPAGAGAVDVFVSRTVARAAAGGTGNVKTGGNYAVTLKVIAEVKKFDCAQVLFLDAVNKRRVEELGGMNVFFVRDGELVTPALTDTILPGVTRDSILTVARDLGIRASEETIYIDDVLKGIQDGRITEAIACGTAAVLTGIRTLRMEDGDTVHLPEAPGPVTAAVYERLVGIQYGRHADTHGWMTLVHKP